MANRQITTDIKILMMSASDLPLYSLNGPAVVKRSDYSDHYPYEPMAEVVQGTGGTENFIIRLLSEYI